MAGGKYEALRIEERLDSIRGWAMHGSTMAEIASMLGVAESTVYKWKAEHETFREALKKGADEADGEILNAAFRQAVGYVVRVQEPVKVKRQRWDDKSQRFITDEEVVTVEYDKTIPPDANMTRFMLINRIPECYRMKQEVESRGSITLSEEDRKLFETAKEALK